MYASARISFDKQTFVPPANGSMQITKRLRQRVSDKQKRLIDIFFYDSVFLPFSLAAKILEASHMGIHCVLLC